MTALTWLWWCMTPVVLIFGAALWLASSDENERDEKTSLKVSLYLFVPSWWSVYWLIRLVAEMVSA